MDHIAVVVNRTSLSLKESVLIVYRVPAVNPNDCLRERRWQEVELKGTVRMKLKNWGSSSVRYRGGKPPRL